jgi:hypothetical protein
MDFHWFWNTARTNYRPDQEIDSSLSHVFLFDCVWKIINEDANTSVISSGPFGYLDQEFFNVKLYRDSYHFENPLLGVQKYYKIEFLSYQLERIGFKIDHVSFSISNWLSSADPRVMKKIDTS